MRSLDGVDGFHPSKKFCPKFHALSSSPGFLGGRAVSVRVGKVSVSELKSENGQPEEKAT